MDVLDKLGIKKGGGSFEQTLFYFFREFKINPYDEEYIVYDDKGKLVYKIVKKGMPQTLFKTLWNELIEQTKRDEAEMKKASRGR